MASPEAASTEVRAGRPPPWRDVRVLRVVFQLVVLAIITLIVLYLGDNLTTNQARQGIRRDFGFLNQPTGFKIADSDFRASQPIRDALGVGAKNTAAVAFMGIALATVLGIIVGVARLSTNWLVRRAASLYVEFIRNVPVVLIIVFIFLAVILRLPRLTEATELFGAVIISNELGFTTPSLERTGAVTGFTAGVAVTMVAATAVVFWRTRVFDRKGEPHHRVLWALGVLVLGIAASYVATGGPVILSLPERDGRVITGGISMPAAFSALLAGLVIYTASHVAEIVRGSIQAVAKGQSEASSALGLNEFQRYRFVILPQAFRIMIPPLANQYLNLTKNSSLAVFIAYPEIARITGITISQGNPAFQLTVIVMGIYLVFSIGISVIANLVNRRLQLVTR